MAPGAVDKADTHPVSCGPFKFKSWKRFDTCELVRFENFWETDAEGNTLPYLDGMIGKPKKEDRVRLTALRTNEVDLIDNVAYADAPNFIKEHGELVQHLAGAAGRHGVHRLQPQERAVLGEGQSRRPSAAHGGRARDRPRGHPRGGVQQAGRDRQGVLQRVPARGTARTSSRGRKFDPDKAKAMRKKAKGGDAKLLIIANDSFPYMQQSGELVHAMLKDAGFDVTFEIHPTPVIQDKYNKGDVRSSIRRRTATASIPTAGTRARSCRRRRRPSAATATRTRRSTS